MSRNDKFEEEVEKRLLHLEKIAKEIFKQVELLKTLLSISKVPTQKGSESISMEKPEIISEKSSSDCIHYLGYLRFLPKSKSIPDECLSCQKVIECFKQEE